MGIHSSGRPGPGSGSLQVGAGHGCLPGLAVECTDQASLPRGPEERRPGPVEVNPELLHEAMRLHPAPSSICRVMAPTFPRLCSPPQGLSGRPALLTVKYLRPANHTSKGQIYRREGRKTEI